jgi:regulator of replication initiation timing
MSQQQREEIEKLVKRMKKMETSLASTEAGRSKNAISIKKLREEVKSLETENKALKMELDQARRCSNTIRDACDTMSDLMIEEVESIRCQAAEQSKAARFLKEALDPLQTEVMGMHNSLLSMDRKVTKSVEDAMCTAVTAKTSLCEMRAVAKTLETETEELAAARERLEKETGGIRTDLREIDKNSELKAEKTRRMTLALAQDLIKIADTSGASTADFRKSLALMRHKLQQFERLFRSQHGEIGELKQAMQLLWEQHSLVIENHHLDLAAPLVHTHSLSARSRASAQFLMAGTTSTGQSTNVSTTSRLSSPHGVCPGGRCPSSPPPPAGCSASRGGGINRM